MESESMSRCRSKFAGSAGRKLLELPVVEVELDASADEPSPLTQLSGPG